MNTLIAKLWRAMRGTMQWRVLHFFHATFMIGVTGLIRDDHGRVLLLRHRLWPEDRQWGAPTGYARKNERFEDTVTREVREETGLEVEAMQLVRLKSGFKYRVEIAYLGTAIGGKLNLSKFEVLDHGWFDLDDLPKGILPTHLELIQANEQWFKQEPTEYQGGNVDHSDTA